MSKPRKPSRKAIIRSAIEENHETKRTGFSPEEKLLAARVIVEEKTAGRKANIVIHKVILNVDAADVVDFLTAEPFDKLTMEERMSLMDGNKITKNDMKGIIMTLSVNFA